MSQRFKIIITIISLSFSIYYAEAYCETVRMAIGEWPPYTSGKDNDSRIFERVVTEAFRLEGVDVKYEYFPWKRSYIYTIEGRSDATFPWTKTEERKKIFYLNSEPLAYDDGVFFYLKRKNFNWNTLDDLKKYSVGVTVGFKQEEIYRKLGIPFDMASSEESNFRKLFAGRIDVYWTSKTVGYTMIRRLYGVRGMELFTHHPRVAEKNEYYILFSRKSKDGKLFRDKFDPGLRKLRESGVYDRILSGK